LQKEGTFFQTKTGGVGAGDGAQAKSRNIHSVARVASAKTRGRPDGNGLTKTNKV